MRCHAGEDTTAPMLRTIEATRRLPGVAGPGLHWLMRAGSSVGRAGDF
jgi:hypothetical protein